MPANVEIKAHLRDVKGVNDKARELSGGEGTVIPQEDTFFNVPQGRLKLRVLKGVPAQLIFYERKDQTGPKFSDYHITHITDPEGLKVTLGKCLGVKGVVKKTRILYMVGQTRVHVDKVDGLGDFMELEVVMKEGQSVEEGQEIADSLMKKLGIESSELLSGAYMDMILQNGVDK